MSNEPNNSVTQGVLNASLVVYISQACSLHIYTHLQSQYPMRCMNVSEAIDIDQLIS